MATTRKPRQGDYLVARPGQPLISVKVPRDGLEEIFYFTDEQTARTVVAQLAPRSALELAGAWSDLDWDEVEAELQRIRREQTITPAFDDGDS